MAKKGDTPTFLREGGCKAAFHLGQSCGKHGDFSISRGFDGFLRLYVTAYIANPEVGGYGITSMRLRSSFGAGLYIPVEVSREIQDPIEFYRKAAADNDISGVWLDPARHWGLAPDSAKGSVCYEYAGKGRVDGRQAHLRDRFVDETGAELK